VIASRSTHRPARFLCEGRHRDFYTGQKLQGISFKGVVRTPNFGQLRSGRDDFPFAFLGSAPVRRAVRRGRRHADREGNQGVPLSLQCQPLKRCKWTGRPAYRRCPSSGLTSLICSRQAFSQTAITEGRPTSREWVAALQKLEANSKQCANNRGHWHPSHLSTCPWCQLEAQGANLLFPFVIPFVPGGSVPTLDVEAFWRQIPTPRKSGDCAPGCDDVRVPITCRAAGDGDCAPGCDDVRVPITCGPAGRAAESVSEPDLLDDSDWVCSSAAH